MTTDNLTNLHDLFSRWTTIKEAANIVDRDHSTIRLWVAKGKIRCFNLGSSSIRVVNIKEVQEYSAKTVRLKRSSDKKKKI